MPCSLTRYVTNTNYFFVIFQIKVLEKLRLSTLRKTSVSAEKETKDGPRMFSNIPTTVTKGVKFAVSMIFIIFTVIYDPYSFFCSKYMKHLLKIKLSSPLLQCKIHGKQ